MKFNNNTPIVTIKVRAFKTNKILKQIYKSLSDTNMDLKEFERMVLDHFKISKKQLTYWLENTGTQPTISQFTEWAQLLNCTIDDLVETSETTIE
jgi:hypothetical protein